MNRSNLLLPRPDGVMPKPHSQSRAEPVRTVRVAEESGLAVGLHFYPPRARQPTHVDELPGVSLVLAGAVQEKVGREERTRSVAGVALKPPCVRHSARFSDDGAVIVSISFQRQTDWEAFAGSGPWRWRRLARAGQLSLPALFARMSLEGAPADFAVELLAAAAADRPGRGTPPEWLRRAAERLRDEPGLAIERLAAESSVHPVYLARAFRRWFEVPPSVFRHRAMTDRAVRLALLGSAPATEAAYVAGFSDQSHMCRALKRALGFPLSDLRSMLKSGRVAARADQRR